MGMVAGALLVTLATPQLSAVTGVPSAGLVAKHAFRSVLIVISGGQVIVGGIRSAMVTF